jgi:hypothetical protein
VASPTASMASPAKTTFISGPAAEIMLACHFDRAAARFTSTAPPGSGSPPMAR